MDNLTHGLLGLAVASLHRKPSRAVPLACVLAAELPDLDSLWPAANEVVAALQAHRGPSHSLLAAPVVAAVASGLSLAVFRKERFAEVFPFSLLSVVFAHLLPDLWTGWGTRLLLPFSDRRLSLDWTMVVDPFVTVPLLVAAVLGWRFRPRWRQTVRWGLLWVVAYIAGRVVTQQVLRRELGRHYVQATQVAVFPSWLGPWRWRFVAVHADEYVLGSMTAAGRVSEENRVPKTPSTVAWVANVPTVREALAWARYPQIQWDEASGKVRISDLRYHLKGQPTLAFDIELTPGGEVKSARLHRGGTASELLRRYRR